LQQTRNETEFADEIIRLPDKKHVSLCITLAYQRPLAVLGWKQPPLLQFCPRQYVITFAKLWCSYSKHG